MTQIATILVVDDEPGIRELLAMTLQRLGHQVVCAADLAEARTQLRQQAFQLCLTDMRLPDGNGLELITEVNRQWPELPIAMLTAYGNVETAIEALKRGAFDFLTKPLDLTRLRQLVSNALQIKSVPAGNTYNRQELLGHSPAIEQVRHQVGKLARSQAPVYILGESGSGKEVVARMIHNQGPRTSGLFVAINCGAIPEELLESEFFGHEKGAFTGATQRKDGLFHSANGGTLFLDEIADLSLPMQVKLLRAIQEKSVRRIGANQEEAVDVRILSASHKPLAQEVAEGRFRSDLFYRINVIQLDLPPLRERPEDIPLLATILLQRISPDRTLELSPCALTCLTHYSYPGNVRELENILERAATLCDGQLITEREIQLHTPVTTPAIPGTGAIPLFENSAESLLEDYLENIERAAIERALQRSHNNKTEAANLLGLSFRQMRYRCKKLGID